MVAAKPLPPLEFVEGLLKICNTSPSGLRWKVARSNRLKPGQVAGCQNHRGYWDVMLTMDGKSRLYLAHRLVYLLQTGVDPGEMHVDHVNGVRDPLTLRLATHAENVRYQSVVRGGSSRFKGVSWNKSKRKWQAQIMKDGKRQYLGYFVCEKEAAAAYNAAAIELFGEFAKLNNFNDVG